MIQDITGRLLHEGDFLIYVTKTESPSLQFGWVQEIKQANHRYSPSIDVWKIKIQHAHIDGRKKYKEVFKYDEVTNTGGYEETDTLSQAWLTSREGKDSRFMVTRPII